MPRVELALAWQDKSCRLVELGFSLTPRGALSSNGPSGAAALRKVVTVDRPKPSDGLQAGRDDAL